jgi:TPR repeat protein
MDYGFCQRSLQKKSHYCDNLQFQLAAYKLRHDDPEIRRDGFKLVKQLAEKGHGDGMCMYGIVLNEGRVVEADPTQATVWWQRAVDMHRHVQSTYELAVAFFTGEGVAENEELAVIYFERAATMGHAGAAYMLGDCLLDGVGTPRDRAEALEWLVAAGELGHRGARSRVLAVLELEDGTDYGRFTDASRQTLVEVANVLVEDVEEESKWKDGSPERGKEPIIVSIERRFTIGGGSRNPVVLARRRTVVAESRGP